MTVEHTRPAREAAPKEDNNWHLDKKVPLALLMALLVQFGGVMAILQSTRSQGEENTRRITTLEGQRVSERLSTLEAKANSSESLLIRMEIKIDRLAERK